MKRKVATFFLLTILLCALFACGKNANTDDSPVADVVYSYDEVIRRYVERTCLLTKLSKSEMKALHPDAFWACLDFESRWKAYEYDMATHKDYWESQVGAGVTYDINIVNEKKLSGDDLEAALFLLEEWYGLNQDDIGEVYYVDAEVIVKGGRTQITGTVETFCVVRIGGRWHALSNTPILPYS